MFRTTYAALLAVALAACTTTGSIDRSGFDTAVRPQDDLYRAVNGGWLAATPIPADKPNWGSFAILRDLSDQRVRTIVDELAAQRGTASGVARQIGTYYAAFVDTAAIDRAGLAPVAPLLAEIDAIDSVGALAVWQGRRGQGVLALPIGLWVGPDAQDPTVERVTLWQGGLGLPDRDYYVKAQEERYAKALAAYERYLTQLAPHAGERDAAGAARRVLALEHRIAQAHWERVRSRDPVQRNNPMTVAELAKSAPGFDWSAFMAAAQLGGQERVNVSQPSAAAEIAKLYSEVALADWKLYFKLRLLDDAAPTLPQALRDAHFELRGRALGGATAPPARWQDGAQAVNAALGEAVGQVYVQRHFPPAAKARMQDLVRNLLAAYQESIDALNWMTPATKAQAQDKLARYSVKIGYPDRWRDYARLDVREGDALGNALRAQRFEWERIAAKAGKPVDRSEWGATPQTVNAYYSASKNEIVFPAAILQPPFFDMAADDAVNYGAIGAVIGHEISHGFDDAGSRYDGSGALRNWWSPADRQAFEAIGTQLASQYDRYEALPGKRVNGRLTLGENIADLSGLQIAWKAYERSLAGRSAATIDGTTGAQRFFIGWAKIWRLKERDERLLERLTAGPHSPGEFRANGAAINADAFHDAFGTKPGDGMYKPKDERIRIW
jgi:putative endopeptidase